MTDDVTIGTYEPCPDCKDGSCRRCGAASSEHAAPGVRRVLRQLRFVRCKGCANCNSKVVDAPRCGPVSHPKAAVGVLAEVVETHSPKRWVPAMHLPGRDKDRDNAACGVFYLDKDRLTTNVAEVTCRRCQKTK